MTAADGSLGTPFTVCRAVTLSLAARAGARLAEDHCPAPSATLARPHAAPLTNTWTLAPGSDPMPFTTVMPALSGAVTKGGSGLTVRAVGLDTTLPSAARMSATRAPAPVARPDEVI